MPIDVAIFSSLLRYVYGAVDIFVRVSVDRDV